MFDTEEYYATNIVRVGNLGSLQWGNNA